MKDFIWYGNNGIIVALEEVLQNRLVAAQVGHHYEIQKNRMNNQIVTQNRNTHFPKCCAVEASIEILKLAMSCGEKTVGISIHYIEEGIDTGKIILQDEVEISPRTTLDHMLKVTKLKGAELLIKAIKQIAEGTAEAFHAEGGGTYFSFPTPESYKKFKKHGYKLWRFYFLKLLSLWDVNLSIIYERIM